MKMQASDCSAIIHDLIALRCPKLGPPLKVYYRPCADYLYMARGSSNRLMLVTGLPLNHPQLMQIVERMMISCLELYESRTQAVEIHGYEENAA